jgi:hypothetical protein
MIHYVPPIRQAPVLYMIGLIFDMLCQEKKKQRKENGKFKGAEYGLTSPGRYLFD